MNCKQGDLAIVVKSVAGNEGRVVTCLKLLPAGYAGAAPEYGPLWEVDGQMRTVWRLSRRESYLNIAPDSFLRPIRPNGVTDQEVTELYTPQEPAFLS